MLSRKSVMLIVALLLLLGVSATIQPVIFQEGNPLPVFLAILKVELNFTEIAPVSETKYLQKSGSHDPFNRLLASHGWQFVDQMGAGLFYARNGDRLFVMSRMFTTRYFIYEIERPLY